MITLGLVRKVPRSTCIQAAKINGYTIIVFIFFFAVLGSDAECALSHLMRFGQQCLRCDKIFQRFRNMRYGYRIGTDEPSHLVLNGLSIAYTLRQENGQRRAVRPGQTCVIAPYIQFQWTRSPFVDGIFAGNGKMR